MISRRTFVQKSGATLASVIAVPYINFNTRKKINIGVIGTGDRGGGIISLLKNSEVFNVVACCDVIPFRLEAAVEKSGAKPYENYHDLLDHKDLEAVIIASPFGLHDEMVVDAIAAGKHIYCEKTMSKGMAEIQAVIDAQRSSGLTFQVGHQYNSSDLYQRVQEMIQEGYLGDITAIECQWNRNGDWRRAVPDPKWERAINWRMYREHSGGLVAELCSHQIDFICRSIEEAPKKIVGFGGIDHWKDGRETFDNVHLLFEFPSGIEASFTCTTTNAFDDYKIKILGSKATVIMDYQRAFIYLEPPEMKKEYGEVDGVSGATITKWKAGEGVEIKAETSDITVQALRQFYHSLVDGAEIFADIKSGAITSKCVQMSLDALYQGKLVHWNDYPELVF